MKVRAAAIALGLLAGGANVLTAQQPQCSVAERRVRGAAVATTVAGTNAALYAYFNRAWWSGERRSFWFNNDWDMAFRDQDKFGHLYGGYQITRVGAGLLRFACVSPGKAVLWSALHSTAFQLQIELWDARQKLYGFSTPDVLFNTIGAAYAVGQQHSRVLGAIRPTVSYHQSPARKLGIGENANLRFTTDYAGQTYWLSANPDDLLPERAARLWPGILRFSVGHSVTEYQDPYTARVTRAKRVLVGSVDLDVRRLPGNHPAWRTVKNQLSYYRFPAPALRFTPRVKLVRWYQ